MSYSYFNYFTVNANARVDGSNKFGDQSNDKLLPIWSASANWNLAEHSWMQYDWLDFLSLKASFGYQGNMPTLADQGATVDDYRAKIPDPDHVTFMPDSDNVLPITDDEYFDDDILRYFIDFVRTVYGEETLEQNLAFIAEAIGGKGTSREVIRAYFLKDFFKDHCQTYKKRPIYWLFDSGKKNGFKCLVYMHRYQPDLLARIRTDYVHEQQERYRSQIGYANDALASAERGERVRLDKRVKKLNDQLKETIAFEEKLHHLADQMIKIDLDDGIKVNYAKFQDVLAKIK